MVKENQAEELFITMAEGAAEFVMNSRAHTKIERQQCLNECLEAVKRGAWTLIEAIEASEKTN